jgi:UDP:flavonoid glycosyltransferase YjiC (YdhE family)
MVHEVRSALQGAPVESRADEDRFQEGPIPDAGTRPLAAAGDLSDTDVRLRADLAASLRPSAFPADKERLQAVADEEAAPEEVADLLRRLPDGVRFDRVEAVWEALGHPHEHRYHRTQTK